MKMLLSARKVSFFISIILFSLFNVNCIPINPYPTDVCAPNEKYLGVSLTAANRTPLASDNSSDVNLLSIVLYSRFGLWKNFDTGLEFGTTYFIPTSFMISNRMKLNMSKYSNNAFVFDVGLGLTNLIPSVRASISYLYEPISITIGGMAYTISSFNDVESSFYNSIYSKIQLEDETERMIVPYIYVAYEITKEENIEESNRYIKLGFGATFNWSIGGRMK